MILSICRLHSLHLPDASSNKRNRKYCIRHGPFGIHNRRVQPGRKAAVRPLVGSAVVQHPVAVYFRLHHLRNSHHRVGLLQLLHGIRHIRWHLWMDRRYQIDCSLFCIDSEPILLTCRNYHRTPVHRHDGNCRYRPLLRCFWSFVVRFGLRSADWKSCGW